MSGRRLTFAVNQPEMQKTIALALLGLCHLLSGGKLHAQQITGKAADSIFNSQPYFTIYQDNYFITGIPLNERATKYNSDAKYQISFKQLLTKNVLPFHTYLFLTYTQVAFWDVYRNSSPFAEIDFNPSLGLAKRLSYHDRFIGVASLILEHQSNGRDSISSRSWNRVSLSFQGPVSSKAVLTLKAWLPFAYKDDNPDLLQYLGYGEASLTYAFLPKKLLLDVTLRKGNSDWKGSAQAQIDYRPFKGGNEYFMLQWFQGYAESLISYRDKVSMIRIGIIIKPSYLNFY
jgi:phospholipase A1